MSLDSPAKQQRIERHLMRQRGAGVRTVTASFGFCFGSSAPPSSDATPVRDEPPPKRRKTILRDHPIISNDTETNKYNSIRPNNEATENTSKRVKPRRRFAVDEEEESRAQPRTSSVEDSFVSGLEAKKKINKPKGRPAKPTTASEQSEVDGDKNPAPKGRPRRRAAASAKAKVSDGLAEEAAPIDRKRRDAEPAIGGVRTRKKQVQELEDAIVGAEPPESKPQSKRGRKTVKSTREAASKAVEDLDNTSEPLNQEAAKPAKQTRTRAPAAKTTSSKRKPKEADLQEETVKDLANEQDQLHTLQANEIEMQELNASKDGLSAPATSKKRKREETTPSRPLLTDEPSKLDRQPLGETDMNRTIRSTSPEKASKDTGVTKDSPMAYKGAARGHGPSTSPTKKTTKRRRLHVERDDDVSLKRLDIQCQQPAHTEPRKPEQKKSTASKEKKRQRKAKADNSQPVPKTSVAPMIEIKGSEACPAKDEDVDWLFAPQEPLRKVQSKSRPAAQASQAARPNGKVRDMDLDDLLSNIATLVETKPNASHAGSDVDESSSRRTATASRQRKKRP